MAIAHTEREAARHRELFRLCVMTDKPQHGQQVYIERGRYCRRHAKVTGFPLSFDGFVFLQIYDERGEISKLVDLVPLSYIRAVA